jgi:hypothetical protein
MSSYPKYHEDACLATVVAAYDQDDNHHDTDEDIAKLMA